MFFWNYTYYFICLIFGIGLFLIILIEPVFAVGPVINSVDVTASSVGTTVANTITAARFSDTIRLNGSSFSSTCSSNTVTVNGAAATPTTCTTTVLSGIVVPYGTISGTISVKVSSHTGTFSFTLLPEIDSISPTQGLVGTAVTITGHDLGAIASGSRSIATNNVKFNGTQVADANVTSWTDTSVVAKVPSGATTGNLVLTSGSNVSNPNGVTFTVKFSPNNPSSMTQKTTAGTLSTSTTYYYEVTALTTWGETTPSSQVSTTTGGTTPADTISWNPVAGASYYNVYRGTVSGTMTQYIQTTSTSLIDDGTLNWQTYNFSPGVSDWNQGSPIPNAIQIQFGSTEYNGYAYLVGGNNNGGTYSNQVYYSQLNTGAGPTPWFVTSSITAYAATGMANIGVAAYNGYIYAVGGQDGTSGTSYVNTVYYAKINGDGSLGTWNSTSALSAYSSGAALVGVATYNGFIYAVAGDTAGGGALTTYYAPINGNGSLGSWTSTSSLSGSVEYPNAWAYNGYLYENENGDITDAKINSNGSLQSWRSADPPPISGLFNSFVGQYNGYMYLIGGSNGTYSNTVYYAKLNSDGTYGSWVATTSVYLDPKLGPGGAVTYGGYIYSLGDIGGGTVNSVYYAQINPPTNSSGTINSWQSNTAITQYSSGVENLGVVIYDGYIYAVGGNTASTYFNGVYYAPVYSNGVIGNWQSTLDLSAAYPSGIADLGLVAYNGYIYAIGGSTSLSNRVNTVYYAAVNTDGVLGAWTSTSALTAYSSGISALGAAVYDGYVYAVGGASSSSVNTVYVSQINTSTGALGTWTSTSALTAYSSGIDGLGVVAFDGYVYAVGGLQGSTYFDTVYYAQINTSTGALGTWTSTSALTAYGSGGIGSMGVAVYNGYVYAIGGAGNSGITNENTVYASQVNTSTGALGTWAQVSTLTSYSSGVVGVGGASYNGYMYSVAGYASGTKNTVYSASLTTNSLTVPGANAAYLDNQLISLSWTAVGGASSYKIYRGTSSGSENSSITVSTNSYNDLGASFPFFSSSSAGSNSSLVLTVGSFGGSIPHGTHYCYFVNSITSGVESSYTNEQCITANNTIAVPSGVSTSSAIQATATISSGAWITKNAVVGATISTSNASDTLYLIVEVQPIGNSFTNSTTSFVNSGTGVYESSANNYTGSAITTSINLSGLNSSVQYKWQAAVLSSKWGASSWVAEGGTYCDFGVDTTSPYTISSTQDKSIPQTGVIAYSSAPTQLFSDGFETGNTSNWTSTNGSNLPVVQGNIQGISRSGSDVLSMQTSSTPYTSYVEKTGFNSSYIELNAYFYITSLSLSTNDTMTLLSLKTNSATVANLNLVQTSTGMFIQVANSIGSTTANGSTTAVMMNSWYAFTLVASIGSSGSTVIGYVDGNNEVSLTSQNTGSTNISKIDCGIVGVSGTDTISAYMDDARAEDVSGLTSLSSFASSAYTYTTPYFEWYGTNDFNGSGLATSNANVVFSTSTSGFSTSSDSNEYYTSSTLSSSGYYYLGLYVTDNEANTSYANFIFVYNFAPAGSSPPNSASSLQQYQSNGTTVIPNNTWTTDGISTNVVLTFSMSSPNATDSLTPKVEVVANGSSFSGTPNFTGSAVSYSGTAVTGTVNVTGLTNCTGYKWQAFVSNSNGTSSPVVFNSTTPNFSVSNTAPTAGTVYDGSTSGTEIKQTTSITQFDANWTGFSDTCSGLAATPYTVAIGTTSGGTNILNYTSSGVTTGPPNRYQILNAALYTGFTYYVSVKATNNAGLTTIVTSPGQSIMPTLTFSVDSSSVGLGNWNSTNSYTTTATNTLSALTDAHNGYNIYVFETGPLTRIQDNTTTIPDVSFTYASPQTWTGGTTGFGYTSSCTLVNSNQFATGTKFAAFNHTGPGDIVAQSSINPITGANYTGVSDSWTITYKTGTTATKLPGNYQTSIIYSIVPNF